MESSLHFTPLSLLLVILLRLGGTSGEAVLRLSTANTNRWSTFS